jgi:signal transduction histidine kinase
MPRCSALHGARSGEVVDSKAGMRVELPELLSVLSHELRGPLGILQGYLRLMQRQRPAGDPDTTILTAMLEATGRLAAIGRQVDNLREWCGPSVPDVAMDVPARDLAEAAARAAGGALVLTEGARACDSPLRLFDRDGVAAALVALSVHVSRERGEREVTLDAAADDDGDHVMFTVTPAPDGPAPEAPPPAVAFDSGGQGLSLVIASYVLDRHGAVATPADPPGAVQVRFVRGRTSV